MVVKDPCKLLDQLCNESNEKDWLEFKVGNVNPSEIGQYISALANSAMLADRDWAYLVFGIENNTRKKVGTKVNLGLLKGKGNEGLQNWLARKVDPALYIEYLDFECSDLKFAIICIEPSYERPVKFDGIAYVRIGEHKKELSAHPQHERSIWLATGRRKFEDSIAAAGVDVEDVLRLLSHETYFALTGEPIPTAQDKIIKKLESFGAIQQNMEGTYDILNLGAILLANNVRDFPSIKGKSVRVIKYKGKDKKSSEPEREGSLGYAVGFKGLVKHIMSRSTEEIYEGGVRKVKRLVPEVVVREIVSNALIHQDFTTTGSGPVVEIYSDRIEVINPGNSLIAPDRMIDERKSRNEKLAGAMRSLGLCEERGGGLDKALLAIEDEHLPAPSFVASQDSMRVVLFGHKPFKKMSALDKERACFFHCVIRWIRHDYMSNATLRDRFGLPKEDYQAASTIITSLTRKKRIVPADPQQGKKNRKYVPYFA